MDDSSNTCVHMLSNGLYLSSKRLALHSLQEGTLGLHVFDHDSLHNRIWISGSKGLRNSFQLRRGPGCASNAIASLEKLTRNVKKIIGTRPCSRVAYLISHMGPDIAVYAGYQYQ